MVSDRRRKFLEIDLATNVVVKERHTIYDDRSGGFRLHRDEREGPALIERNPESGLIVYAMYYWRGRRHREGGPAAIEYSQNGETLLGIDYMQHGVPHRDPREGPAQIRYSFSGNNVATEEYYRVNGQEWRSPEEGPCYIARTQDGRVIEQEFSDPDEAPPTRPRRKRSPRPAEDEPSF